MWKTFCEVHDVAQDCPKNCNIRTIGEGESGTLALPTSMKPRCVVELQRGFQHACRLTRQCMGGKFG